MSRLHPIPYGAGVLLVPDWCNPPARRARRQAAAPQGVPPCTHLTLPARRDSASRTPPASSRSTPSETGRTTVELEALRDDDATREAIERATVELNGNEVLVEIGVGGKGFGVGPAWISFGRTPQVGVRIRCPEGSDLDCMTASADVAATGRLGEVEMKTASGDVAVEHVAGLRVQSASGDVRGATVDGDARLQTVSGDIRLGTVTGPVDVDARLRRLRDRRGAHRPGGQDRLRRPADRRRPRGADQAPVGLRRRPARCPARYAGCASTPTR